MRRFHLFRLISAPAAEGALLRGDHGCGTAAKGSPRGSLGSAPGLPSGASSAAPGAPCAPRRGRGQAPIREIRADL
eukprot:1982984-Pyramimonas_sp.AAC.1